MTLEPSHILLMVPPTLFLELTSRKILLIRALSIVEDEEKGIRTKLFKNSGIFEDGRGVLGVARWSGVGVARSIRSLPLAVHTSRHLKEGIVQCVEVMFCDILGSGCGANL